MTLVHVGLFMVFAAAYFMIDNILCMGGHGKLQQGEHLISNRSGCTELVACGKPVSLREESLCP